MGKAPIQTNGAKPPTGPKPVHSEEFFIEGTNPKQDAALHADMIEGPHAEEANKVWALRSAIRAVEEYGVDEEVAASLYGVSLAELEDATD